MKLLHRRLHVFTTSPRWQPSVEWTVKNACCIVFSSSHMTRMKHIHCTSNNNAAHYRLYDANLLAYLAATRLITSDLLGFFYMFSLFFFSCSPSQVLSLIILICYAASLYGGYSAVAICEMVFAIVFFVIFMMELDKQFQVVSWVWSVSYLCFIPEQPLDFIRQRRFSCCNTVGQQGLTSGLYCLNLCH